ncbi:MAG: hypothetical protein IIC01_03720 [Planctomycetes bacterium]|nr:hypothetical protein [Planctomycetota bacterium]
MNRQKGIKRTVFVVSIIAFILKFLRVSKVETLPIALIVAGIIFVFVWLCYFAVLWIVKGFRDENKKEMQQQPTRKTNFYIILYIILAGLVMFIFILLVAFLIFTIFTDFNLAAIIEALNNL